MQDIQELQELITEALTQYKDAPDLALWLYELQENVAHFVSVCNSHNVAPTYENKLQTYSSGIKIELKNFGVSKEAISFIYSLKDSDGVWLSLPKAEKQHEERFPSLNVQPGQPLSYKFTNFTGKTCTAKGENLAQLARSLAALGYTGPEITLYQRVSIGFVSTENGSISWGEY